ncbi:MAG: hypothetical protein JWL80_440 [Parcubacteria group bacterium]|nr:hypothetical protein [Parcubacteria group bacterium]
MKKFNFYLTAVLLASAVFGPFGVSAALLGGSSSGTGVDSGVTAAVNTANTLNKNSVQSAGDVGGNRIDDTSGTVQVQGSASVNSNTGTNTAIPDTSSSIPVNYGVESATGVSFDRSNTLNAEGAAVEHRTVENVTTTNDLKVYAAGNFQSDANLQNMEFSGNKVVVGYNERGRFLGLIPVTMNVKTEVDGQGNVTTHYPWYNFLVSNDRAELEASLKTRISNILSARTDSSASLTIGEQARVAAEVYAIMKDRFDSSNSGQNATTTGNY